MRTAEWKFTQMFPAKSQPAPYSPARFFFLAVDIASAAAAPFFAFWVRDLFEGASSGRGSFAVYAASSAAVSLILLWSAGCFRATCRYFELGDACRAAQAIALGVAIGALCGFAFNRLADVARAIPFLQVLVQVSLFAIVRKSCQKLGAPAQRSVGKAKQVLIVGSDAAALAYLNAVRDLARGSIEIAGFLTTDQAMVGKTIRGKRVLGTVMGAEEVIATLQVHGVEIWKLAVAMRLSQVEALYIDTAATKFSISTIDVETVLSAFRPATEIAEAEKPQQAVPLAWKPLYSFTKRSVDLAGSALLLTALAPLMMILCPVVALDVGFPVLFWQQRLGRDGKRLTIYKFRTMRAPLDRTGRRLPDAERVSVVGRWMRKLRLDELPQLITILKGDMSFVGPRPLLPIDQPSDAARRLAVKPGLTGWAQVHGGNLVAIDDKNALDLWYVAHSSLRLDIEIALRTIAMLLKGDHVDSQKIDQAKNWLSGFDYAEI